MKLKANNFQSNTSLTRSLLLIKVDSTELVDLAHSPPFAHGTTMHQPLEIKSYAVIFPHKTTIYPFSAGAMYVMLQG